MSTSKRVLLFAVAGMFIFGTLFCGVPIVVLRWLNSGTTWTESSGTGYAKRLPQSATNVLDREWSEPGLLSQDFCILMRADMPKQDAEAYARSLDFSALTDELLTTPPEWLGWGPCSLPNTTSPDWWSPSNRNTGVYFRERDGLFEYLKWEDGRLYLKAYNI